VSCLPGRPDDADSASEGEALQLTSGLMRSPGFIDRFPVSEAIDFIIGPVRLASIEQEYEVLSVHYDSKTATSCRCFCRRHFCGTGGIAKP